MSSDTTVGNCGLNESPESPRTAHFCGLSALICVSGPFQSLCAERLLAGLAAPVSTHPGLGVREFQMPMSITDWKLLADFLPQESTFVLALLEASSLLPLALLNSFFFF